MKMRVRIQCEPRDVFIGVYFKNEYLGYGRILTTLWICVIPMLPIVWQINRPVTPWMKKFYERTNHRSAK